MRSRRGPLFTAHRPAEGSAGDALRALLGGLCETDEDRTILDALCEAAREASDSEFSFEDHEFEYAKGTGAVHGEGVPKSFGEIADAAFSYGQNWTFFDPTRTLGNGEPALAFVSHEGGGGEEVKSADALNYKQIFLRMISDAMLETNYLPELYC